MASPHRPNGPRDERGPLSWATAVNDSTVEWLAALARILCVVWALVAANLLLYLTLRPSWGVALAVLLTLAYSAGTGWLGYVQLGNYEWKGKPDGPAD